MRYLIPLLLISSSAVADMRIVPDGIGGYRVIESASFAPPNYSNNYTQTFGAFGQQQSLGSQVDQSRLYRQQMEMMDLENEMLRRRLGR